ncbi:glutamine amidotransferase [Cellulomonas sp. SLBN-39]|uniref:glutamine amidotransferase n=1 Tax=Cellulomonas sp. SLBN-39 TaxID=2768446 RepID=UPI0011540F41|nr:glutamine amidotransferase [Cellulomonas sp. SLBN-39]TQL03405.1 GMP synthase (glutamine-hydrolysing) [Cellulomonas sp. SLBN-39]
MRPFLFLGVRPEDGPADDEYAAMLRCTGLDERDLRRVRVEAAPLAPVDPQEVAGIVLGGGPFQVSDPERTKSAVQRRVESDLARLLDVVVAADLPFLGACYGIGTLGRHQGGHVDRTYGEPVGAVRVELTAEGRSDPVLGVGPATFEAFGGHKEALRAAPPGATLLARSPGAPVQAFRVGRHVYATQFHPELDTDGLVTRVQAYRHEGYFAPQELEDVVARARAAAAVQAPPVLRAFVRMALRLQDDGTVDGGRPRGDLRTAQG